MGRNMHAATEFMQAGWATDSISNKAWNSIGQGGDGSAAKSARFDVQGAFSIFVAGSKNEFSRTRTTGGGR